MKIKSEYWRAHWDKSAKENDDIRNISGWGNRTFQEMLFAITDVSKKLELKNEDKLLEVGCGAGLFEITFAHWLKEIYGVDYSNEMANIAKKNTEKYDNIIIEYADIRDLPFDNEIFDKVLVNSVIQYLDDLDEVKKAFKELKRVAKKGAKILVSMNFDADKKEDFFGGYYNLGLSEEEIKKKIMMADMVLWFDRNELKKIAEQIGFEAKILEMDRDVWQSKYYFNMLLTKME